MSNCDEIQKVFDREIKIWKDKIANYDNIIKMIQSGMSTAYLDGNVTVILSLLDECNVLAFEKALEMILCYLKSSIVGVKNLKSEANVFIEKCFKSARGASRNLCQEILILFADKFLSETVDILIEYVNNTKPIIANGAIETLIEIIKKFKNVSVKKVVAILPNILESRDKQTREFAKRLSVEIWVFHGSSKVEPFLKDLKPIQLNEIKAESENRLIEKVSHENNFQQFGQIDADDLLDLSSKLTNEFFEKLESTLRQERKEALDDIEMFINGHHILPGNYREFIKKLCQIISKDTQINTVIVALEIVHHLAFGLGKHFSAYSIVVVECCLEKFKDKKLGVLNGVRKCIDLAVVHVNIDGLLTAVKESLRNKNPAIRSESILFIGRFLKTVRGKSCVQKLVTGIMPLASNLCKDSDEFVRESTFELVANFIDLVSRKEIMTHLDSLDSAKIQRINALVSIESKKSDEERNDRMKIVDVPVANKPILIKKQLITHEEPKLLGFDENFFEELQKAFTSNLWKDRQSAADRLLNRCIDETTVDKTMLLAVVETVLSKPGLKDNNLAVVKRKLEVLRCICERSSGKVPNVIAEQCIGELVEKVGDAKIGTLAKSVFEQLLEKSIDENQLVLRAIQLCSESKSIRSVTEMLDCISGLTMSRRIRYAKDAILILKQLLASQNQLIKQKTINLIGAIYKHAGRNFIEQFDTEKQIIIDSIEKEIKKIDKILEEENKLKRINQNITETKTPTKQNSTSVVSERLESCLKNEDITVYSNSINHGRESFYEIKDEARSTALEICQKLRANFDRYGKNDFEKELVDIFSMIKAMGEVQMMNCVNCLHSVLSSVLSEKETVSTQTDETIVVSREVIGQTVAEDTDKHKETEIKVSSEIDESLIPVENKENKYQLKEFINTRRNRRQNIGVSGLNFSSPSSSLKNRKKYYADKDEQTTCIPSNCLPITAEIIENQSYETESTLVTVPTISKHQSLCEQILNELRCQNFSASLYQNIIMLFKGDCISLNKNLVIQLVVLLIGRGNEFIFDCESPENIQKFELAFKELTNILTVLKMLVDKKELSQSLDRDCLISLFHFLFSLLSQTKVCSSTEKCKYLTKLLSSLIIELADSIDQTQMICTFLKLLYWCFSNGTHKSNYASLVVRTFCSRINTLKCDVDVVNIREILVPINETFNCYFDINDIASSMAFKALKTLVHTLTLSKKMELIEFLPEQNNHILRKYIIRCNQRAN